MQLKVHLLTQYLRDLGFISEFVSDGNGDDIKLNCIRLRKSISSSHGDAFNESSNFSINDIHLNERETHSTSKLEKKWDNARLRSNRSPQNLLLNIESSNSPIALSPISNINHQKNSQSALNLLTPTAESQLVIESSDQTKSPITSNSAKRDVFFDNSVKKSATPQSVDRIKTQLNLSMKNSNR